MMRTCFAAAAALAVFAAASAARAEAVDLGQVAELVGLVAPVLGISPATLALAGVAILAAHAGASAFVAATRTPDPSTAWGIAYRVIEIAALAVGKAKERGKPSEISPAPRRLAFVGLVGASLALASCASIERLDPVAEWQATCRAVDVTHSMFVVGAIAADAGAEIFADELTVYERIKAECAGAPPADLSEAMLRATTAAAEIAAKLRQARGGSAAN